MSIRLLIHTLIRRCSVLSGVSACRRVAVSCLLGFAFLTVTVSGATAQNALALPEVPDLTFSRTGALDFQLPEEATGGTPPYSYGLAPETAVEDLTSAPSQRRIQELGLDFILGSSRLQRNSLEPVRDSDTFTFFVQDSTIARAARNFDISYAATALSLSDPDDIILTLNVPIDTAIELPEASGGTETHTYYLYGLNGRFNETNLVPGVTFDSDTRMLTGTPTELSDPLVITYHVQDTGTTGTKAGHAQQTFRISVYDPLVFAETQPDLELAVGVAADETLPVATGGDGNYTYTLTGPSDAVIGTAVPGLDFNTDTRMLTGSPDAVTSARGVMLTYKVADGSNNEVEQTFIVTVSVVTLGEVEDQTYTMDEPIDPMMLPEAVGAGTSFTYTLTGPDDASLNDAVPGLVFTASSRTLSGTPREVTPPEGVMLTYKVTDNNSDEAEQTFTVTVIAAAAFNDLNKVLLPEIARAMADSTTSAIARRIEQAGLGQAGLGQAGADDSTSVNIGGQNSLAEALTTYGKAVAEGERDFRTLLTGSDFVLPLAAAGNGAPRGGLSSMVLWGSGEYRSLDGRSGSIRWDGDLIGAHAGIDGRLRQNLLLGMAVSWHQSDMDYQVNADSRGSHELSMISAHPYVGWNTNKLDLWATAGYGQGDLDITPAGGDKGSSDVNLLTAGVGGNSPLWRDDGVKLLVKGEAVWSQLEAEGSATIDKLKVDATRLRLTLEASRSYALSGGSRLEPSLEAGVRHDGGDGETGAAGELGAGLNFHSPDSRVSLGGRARLLMRRGNDNKEWGVQGHVRVLPDAGGQGFSFSLAPGYGDSNSSVRQVWQRDLADNLAANNEGGEGGADDYRMHLNTRLGYGFIMPGYNGVITPYSEVALGDAATYGLGMNWALASGVDLTLHGERRVETNADAEHAILLKGAMEF